MSVVVVGAAVMDLKGRSRAPLVRATSNPATVVMTPGGVGRNIAENLARLGTPVCLVAAVGPDAAADRLLADTAAAGVDTSHVMTTPEPTGTYIAVLDPAGELDIALSDLAATQALTPARLEPSRAAIEAARMLVVDGNLPAPVVGWLLDVAAAAGVPVVVEPVSVAKAARLRESLRPGRPVAVLTPNADELAALGPTPGDLTGRGVRSVWVRRGAHGSDWYATGRPGVRVAAHGSPVVDVTGAGDAMTAGWVHAHLGGARDTEAVAYGQAVAELTVSSSHTVRPDLTDALVRARLEETA